MFAYFWGQIIFCRIISNVYLQSSDVSDDVNDFKALTPNHFTIGSECYIFTTCVFEKQEINLWQKWCWVQATATLFWDTWKREYLPMLNIRRKWALRYRNFQVGDSVVISIKDLLWKS